MQQHQIVDDSRVGYPAAVSLVGIESGQSWARFNAMMVANSILVGAAAVILTQAMDAQKAERSDELAALSILSASAGMAVCFLWWSMVWRSFKVQLHYLSKARELERKLVGVSTLDKNDYDKALCGIVNIPQKWAATLTILTFFCLYGSFLGFVARLLSIGWF